MKLCYICNKNAIQNEETVCSSIACNKIDEQNKRDEFIARNDAIENKIRKHYLNFLPKQNNQYIIDIDFLDLEESLESYAKRYSDKPFEYNPDFQRGHVWSLDKQIKYIESFIMDTLNKHQKTITINHPLHRNSHDIDTNLDTFCMVDGLQRTTAIIAFCNNKFKVFGDMTIDDFNKTKYSLKSSTIHLNILNYTKKVELLKYYVTFNRGGVIHSDEEIQRVEQMIQDEQNQSV